MVNTFWSMAGRIVSSGLGVAVAALLSRYLGVEGFGVYALLISYGALLQTVADFGLYLTVTRDLAVLDTSRRQRLLASAVGLRVVLAFVVFGGGFIVASLLPQYRAILLPFAVVSVGFLFQSLSQLLMGVYQTYESMWRAALGDLLGRLVQFVVVASLVFFPVSSLLGGDIAAAAIAFFLSTGVAYMVHGYLVPGVSAWRVYVSLYEWKRLLVASWPLATLLILSAIYFRIDMVMLSWYRSEAEVGWYALAYRVIESLLFVPAAFGGILLPKFSAATGGGVKINSLVAEALHVLLVAAAGVSTLLIVGGGYITTFLSGDGFEPSGSLLIILSLALFVMFFGNLFGFVLVAQHKQRVLLVLYAALAVFNIVANIVFIPLYGASAAAWTTVATEVIATVVAGAVLYAVTPFSISPVLVGKVVLVSAITFFVGRTALVHAPVLVALGSAGAVYGFSAWSVGLFARRHMHLLTKSSHEDV